MLMNVWRQWWSPYVCTESSRSLWTVVSTIAAAPALLLTWYWRTSQREQDLANRRQELKNAAKAHALAERVHADGRRESSLSHELSKKAQFNERYITAVELLGKAERSTRMGAIYSLEQLWRDSPAVHAQPVFATLGGFVRDWHREPAVRGQLAPGPRTLLPPQPESPQRIPTDVQAAISVLSQPPPASSHIVSNLVEAHLSGAFLGEAKLRRVLFNHANLEGANFEKAELSDANLSHAILRSARFTDAVLNGADLSGAKADHAIFKGAQLKRTKLHFTSFNKAELWNANFECAVAIGTSFVGAELNKCHLIGATFSNVDFRDAIFWCTDLTGATFTGVRFEGAFFHHARFEGADFKRACVAGAHFSDARLAGANLEQVEGLTAEQLNEAFGDESTKLPSELAHVKLRPSPDEND